eukprot:jgi/Galph1/1103/GphlegSOOS_G5912.1
MFSVDSQRSATFNIISAGIAFSAVRYVEYVLTILKIFFPVEHPTIDTSAMSSRVSDSLLMGAIVDQVMFGVISDRVEERMDYL